MHLVELRWLLGCRHTLIVLAQLRLVQQIVDQVLHHDLRFGRLQFAYGDRHVLPEDSVLIHMTAARSSTDPARRGKQAGDATAVAVAQRSCCRCCRLQGCGQMVVVASVDIVVVGLRWRG